MDYESSSEKSLNLKIFDSKTAAIYVAGNDIRITFSEIEKLHKCHKVTWNSKYTDWNTLDFIKYIISCVLDIQNFIENDGWTRGPRSCIMHLPVYHKKHQFLEKLYIWMKKSRVNLTILFKTFKCLWEKKTIGKQMKP